MKSDTDNGSKVLVELSRPLKIEGIPKAGVEERIVAKPAEREDLAKRLKVLEIKRFEANLTVEPRKGPMYNVTGGVYAELSQECVVTLDPVEEEVRDSFELLMAPDYVLKKRGVMPTGDYEETDAPEPIEDGVIDLGEIAVQFLAMAINPYPRKEGAVWEAVSTEESESSESSKAPNPFLKLVKSKND